MSLTGRDVAQHGFLYFEICIVALAVTHSAHATVTARRIQSLRCSTDDACAADESLAEAKSLISSGLALAILSAVVFLARISLLQLRHFPRSVGFLYDLLMSILWTMGLAQLTLAQDTARELSNGSVVDADGAAVTCWALRGVAVASIATIFYSARLLFETMAAFDYSRPNDYRTMQMNETESWAESEKPRVLLATTRAPQAYSPVLAFFPDD